MEKPPEKDSGDPSVAAFASRLVTVRTERGLTQDQLAAAAGISQSFISQLEKGKWEPKLTVVLRLAQALGVHPADLLPFPSKLPNNE